MSASRGGVPAWAGEAACSLTLTAVGVWFAAVSSRMPLFDDGVPGPGLAPLMLGVALAAFGIGIAAVAIAKRNVNRITIIDRDSLGAILLLLFAVAAFDGIGFVPATFLFLLSSFVLIGREPWLPSALVAAAATGITWGLFVKALGVPLPAGFLSW